MRWYYAGLFLVTVIGLSIPISHAEEYVTVNDKTTESEERQPYIEAPDLVPLKGMETDPLTSPTWVRFQLVGLHDTSRVNRRFKIDDDGRVFTQENGEQDLDPPARWEAPYPAEPTIQLKPDKVSELKEIVRRNFFSLAPGYLAYLDGGAIRMLEVNLDGRYHRVIVEKARHPVFNKVLQAFEEAVYGK